MSNEKKARWFVRVMLAGMVIAGGVSGCSTLGDCYVGTNKINTSPMIGSSLTGDHIVASLGKDPAQCERVLTEALKLKAKGKL